MTPLQALLAHASPDAPFDRFAGYIEDGSWSLDGDDRDEGLLASALDAAKYNGNDSNLIPLVSAMIAAGARLPPAPEPGQHIATFQPWRNRLHMCGLLVNLARSQTPIPQACDLMAVIEQLSTGDRNKIADIVKVAQRKVDALSGGQPDRFWSARIQGLSTLSFLAATTLTAAPCGIHPGGWSVIQERRDRALAHLIRAHPGASSTALEKLLCQLRVDLTKTPPDSPKPEDMAKLAWNRLSPRTASLTLDWVSNIRDEVAQLPELSRIQSCCAIMDTVSRYARRDTVARELFEALIPVAARAQKQQMRSMAEDCNSLSAMSALQMVSQQMDPAQDIDAAMHVWIAMSKFSMPAIDQRTFSNRMMTALASASPCAQLMQQALQDIEFIADLDQDTHGALQAMNVAHGLQDTEQPTTPSRAAARI